MSSFSTDSSNTNDSTKVQFSFGKCKICDDTATGIHYGIATCEGCKVRSLFTKYFISFTIHILNQGFYKRSLKKHESYFCFQKNNCAINKITRNRCKACRFKKCLKEGMSIDGIRMGRIPKSEKLKSFNELENSGILLVFIIKYQLFNLINAKYKLNKFLKLFFN